MPSAQYKEYEEPLEVITDGRQADLQLFLQALRTSQVNSLHAVYGRGSFLFSEGEQPRGVYILRSGRATVSIASSEGRVVMLRLARAGDVLGLNSVLRNAPYETTVKTLGPCRTDFIYRRDLLEFADTEAGAHVVFTILSRELTEVTDRVKALLLPQTINGRLAKLLLELIDGNGWNASRMPQVEKVFTHEEIAQMICSSRETVTRLLATLSRQEVIRITPDSIQVRDRGALERLALS